MKFLELINLVNFTKEFFYENIVLTFFTILNS